MDKEGVWRTGEQNVGEIAEEYFKNIFAMSNPSNVDRALDMVDGVVTKEMNQSLLRPFVGEEVRIALFQMHPSKSSRPDSMSPFFFQKYWHVVGGDVTEAVLSVLNLGHILTKMNFTHILLITKKKDPQSMSDYRPISLSNVVSRVVSKVLANRVKCILPYIFSDAQSAFVPDRLITDNTTLDYEMLHRLRNRRKGRVGHMAEIGRASCRERV